MMTPIGTPAIHNTNIRPMALPCFPKFFRPHHSGAQAPTAETAIRPQE